MKRDGKCLETFFIAVKSSKKIRISIISKIYSSFICKYSTNIGKKENGKKKKTKNLSLRNELL